MLLQERMHLITGLFKRVDIDPSTLRGREL